MLNPSLPNPGAGSAPATLPILGLIAHQRPFDIPSTQQWNVGMQRQLYARGVIDAELCRFQGRQP